MTDQEINATIAEACGWQKGRKICEGEYVWRNPDGYLRGQCCVPRYCADLNAVATARESLNREQQKRFCEELNNLIHGDQPVGFWDCRSPFDLFRLIDAPASRQAEAILRTIGKWKD